LKNSIWIPGALPFFGFGFVYYFLAPYFALQWIDGVILIDAARQFFKDDFFDFFYFLDCVVVLISWCGGYFLAKRIVIRGAPSLDFFARNHTLSWLLILFLYLFLIFHTVSSYFSGASFFSGYENYDIAVLGPLATTLYISVLFFHFFVDKSIKRAFLLIFLISSILMIGLGSRMFFILGSITLVIGYVSRNPDALKKIYFYLSLILLFSFVVLVGIFRGTDEISSEMFIGIAFAEPLYIATSASTYLANIGERPFLSFPSDLIASLINFIPSAIYPDKLNFIESIVLDVNKFSPFGGSSLLVNLYSNFGVAYPIFVFLIGLFYGYLYKRALTSRFFRAVYFSVLPLLMFYFFREGFITVFKVMFYNSLIFPLIVISFMRLMLPKHLAGSKLQPSDR